VISTDSTLTSVNPYLAIDSKDNVHVVWRDWTDYLGAGTDFDIFYTFWNATSLRWSTTEVVSTESIEGSHYPSLAIDSKDNVHVVWYDSSDYLSCGTDYDIFYKFWNTTSQSWSTTEVVSSGIPGNSQYPNLAIDSMDNVHVVWYDYTDYLGSGTDPDIFYKFWNTTSLSWSITEVVSTESTLDAFSPILAIDGQDNVHVVWWDSTNYLSSGTDYDVFYQFRNSTTQSWSATEVVSTESIAYSSSPILAIDSKDNVHVAWYDWTDYLGCGGDYDIFYKFWNATSQSWKATGVVSTESTSHSSYPSLAIDNQDNAHVAWGDSSHYLDFGTDEDIFYKFWNGTSQSWSTTEVISTESTLASGLPSLAIDSRGIVHMAWNDATNYTSSGTDYDIFYKKGINLDSLGQTVTNTETSTVTNTETETGPTDTVTSTETSTETGPTDTVTSTEISTVFNSDTLYETSTEVILTTSVITDAKSEVTWSLFFLIPVLIVPLLHRIQKRR
jgi:hypothetical protein